MKIVFVHFGSSLPTYLKNNISRVANYFPDLDVALLTDISVDIPELVGVAKVHQISKNIRYSTINSGLSHPKEFRNNFWFTSLARIIALCDFSIATGEDLLHIESDVLISQDFPVKLFEKLDRPISYTILGEKRAVASTFFLKSDGPAKLLLDFIEQSVYINPNTTDMKILGEFQEANPNLVRILASFPTSSMDSYSKLSEQLQDDFRYTLDVFSGYFDGADIGQFLLGDDPRNHRGFKYLRNEQDSSFFKPSSVKYEFNEDRKFINFHNENEAKVYSLHIHSKDPEVFRSRSTDMKLRNSVLNQMEPEFHEFVPRVFVSSVLISLRRRTKAMLKGLRNE